MQQRRRTILIVALVLLPSMIGIATMSWLGRDDQSLPADVPAEMLEQSSADGAHDATGMETPILPEAPGPSPSINVTLPGTDETEEPEQRPLTPETLVASNDLAPSFEFDSFTPEAQFADSGPGFSGAYGSFGRFGAFGGGGGGGGGGSAGNGSPGGDDQTRADNSSGEGSGAGPASDPTLSGPNVKDTPDAGDTTPGSNDAPNGSGSDASGNDEGGSDEGGNDPPGGTYPNDPLPNNPTPPNGGGPGSDGGPKPQVTVPEPSTWGLFGIGLVGLLIGRSRRKQLRS